jgi:acetylornithine/LysW-gamma-L-lysine aminotransferase
LACAAAIATIEIIQRDGLAERADRLGRQLRARLREIRSPMIREVRGLGLLVGIELRSKVTPVLQRLQARGVLALPAGGMVLRLLPPLVISESDLDIVVDAIADSLAAEGGLTAADRLERK